MVGQGVAQSPLVEFADINGTKTANRAGNSAKGATIEARKKSVPESVLCDWITWCSRREPFK